MVFKKGYKSHALRLFGLLLGLIALIGMVAYFINSSSEETKKVSFKAAGLKYKQYFTFTEIVSRPEVRYKNTSSSYILEIYGISTQNGTIQNTTNKNSSMAETVARENMVISSDLQVLSSFDCVKSIPTVLLEYLSNMFLNEYGRSHKDFHSQQRIDEELPLLEKFSINCDVDQNCSALFQYDKQYGLKTSADNMYQREEIFYCCPSVHFPSNEPISNVCKRAQAVVEKSVFRESKESTFLERPLNFLLIS